MQQQANNIFLRQRHLNTKICQRCNKEFISSQWNQIYCGSKTNKVGCSYRMHLKRILDYNLGKNRNWMLEYNKEWKKKQRKLNSPYAERQKELKKEYGRSELGKKVTSKWRKRNIKKILLWNRKRMLQKRGVQGSHTEEEWEDLKKKFNYCCSKCGVSENKLKIIWKKKGFNRLTKDHIVPIAKEGTDYIQNIQPLCISCNAGKKDGEVMKWLR